MNIITCSKILGVFALFALTSAGPTADPLRVVATIPDLADITRTIGGDRVEITTIAKGRENLHYVAARPSHLVALSKADMLVEVGLSLETGFLPGILETCRNPKVQPGAPGFVNCSIGWEPLDVPKILSRKDGDVHPDGNPHMNLDPKGGRQLALRIYEGLCNVDPGSKSAYETRYKAYVAKLDEAEARWAEMAKGWSGKKIVVYHKEYDYFARRYGIDIVGSIETKPGIPPTPGHIAELVEAMKKASPVVILTAPWSNTKVVTEVADAGLAKIVELPNQCGAYTGSETWIGMMDLVHKRVAEAFGTSTK